MISPTSAVAPDIPVIARVRDVRKSWGSTVALDEASLEVRRGITGLVGPNGAGKTTLISLLLGLHPPDAGTLEVLGLTPSQAGPRLRSSLGYAPEYDPFPPDVKAQDFVCHVAELHGLDRRNAISRASETLVLLGLGEERLRQLGTLSTGQRQRVKVAQAVVHDPALVLLDEPTNGLDPLQRDDLLALIRRLGVEFGLNIVVSSHLLHEVERICDVVVVLRDGRVAAERDLTALAAGDGAVLIETVDDVTPLVGALLAAGLQVSAPAPTQALVAAHDETVYDLIRDVLADTGVGVRRLQPNAASLEDLFFSLEAGSPEAGRG